MIFSMHLSRYSLHCVEEITTIAFLNGISRKGVVSAMIDVEQSRSIISAGQPFVSLAMLHCKLQGAVSSTKVYDSNHAHTEEGKKYTV